MTTPDYPDWTTPVIQREQVQTLYNGALAANGGQQVMDTSLFASVDLSWSLFGLGAAGDHAALELIWNGAATAVQYDGLSLHAPASYAGAVDLPAKLSIPVRAPQLQVVSRSAMAGNGTLVVDASTRTQASPALGFNYRTSQPFRYRLDTGVVAVPASSTSARFYLRPVLSKLAIQSDSALAAIHVQVDLVVDASATGVVALPFATLAADGVRPARDVLDVRQLATEVTIVNTDTAAHNVRVQAWDVS